MMQTIRQALCAAELLEGHGTMQPPTKPRRWASLLALILAVAGCGASATARTPAASPTATSTATSVPTANPTQLATAGPCAPSSAADTAPRYAIGDLIITVPSLASMAYPGAQIPEGTAPKPQPLDSLLPQGAFAGTPTNPNLAENGGGYALIVCNASTTQSHVLQSLDVRISELKPYTGQLNEWKSCSGSYARPNGVIEAGCGGYFGANEYLHATFPNGAVSGTAVTAHQTGTASASGNNVPPLPFTLTPSRSISLEVGLTISSSTSPGLYTFAFGIVADGAAPTFVPAASPVLLAPVAKTWSGSACEAPAMQSQIPPATNPPTYYICPAS